MKFSIRDSQYISSIPLTSSTEPLTPPDSDTDESHNLSPPQKFSPPLDSSLPPASAPWPGSLYIIASPDDGRVLTLINGQVILTPAPSATQKPGRKASSSTSVLWRCTESDGWLGFQNPVSGYYLGHDSQDELGCYAKKQKAWEGFVAMAKPDGTYVLKQENYGKLLGISVVPGENSGRLRLGGMGMGVGKEAPGFKFHKVERLETVMED